MKESENGATRGEETESAREERTSGTRRRGKALEKAILAATWEELQEKGYAAVTMEHIAVRAGTNKTAVYRRWPSKSKIVMAAITQYIERPKIEAPGTGDLRGDLLTFMQGFARPIQLIGSETIHGLLSEFYGGKLPHLEQGQGDNKLETILREILRQAEERGEVKKVEEIPPSVLALPMTLLQHKLLIARETLTDEAVTEIIDDIFLPLVRR